MLIEGENPGRCACCKKLLRQGEDDLHRPAVYNTNNDSRGPDDYSETLDEYQKRTGEKSAEGYLNKQSLWKKTARKAASTTARG